MTGGFFSHTLYFNKATILINSILTSIALKLIKFEYRFWVGFYEYVSRLK